MMITMCAFKGRIFDHGIIVFVARVEKSVWGRRGRSTRSGSVYMRVYCTVFEIFSFPFLLAFFFMAMFFSVPTFRQGWGNIRWVGRKSTTTRGSVIIFWRGMGSGQFLLIFIFFFRIKRSGLIIAKVKRVNGNLRCINVHEGGHVAIALCISKDHRLIVLGERLGTSRVT